MGEPRAGHSKGVRAIVISDDGKHIVTGSRDGTVRRWDARTGEEVGKPMSILVVLWMVLRILQ